MRIVDSHSHLNFSQFQGDLETVLSRAAAVDVVGVINVGNDLATSKESIELASSKPNIWATVGVHPHEAQELEGVWGNLVSLAGHPRVIAIGEIGLDYFRNLSPIDVQQGGFKRQLALALKVDKPVVLHCRDAYDDLLSILEEVYLPHRTSRLGILHSFAAGPVQAVQFTERGFYLGVNNLITYPKNDLIREAVKITPLEKLVVETDCPFLPPQALRGSRCEPAYVVSVVEAIAQIKGLTVAEVAEATTTNLEQLFNITWS